MAEIVVMPAMGNTVESCLLTAWRVAVGDAVDANTVLAEIETDKSNMEVPVGAAGTVLALLVAEGDDVPVRQPVAVVGAPGEAVPQELLAPAGTPMPANSVPGSPVEPDRVEGGAGPLAAGATEELRPETSGAGTSGAAAPVSSTGAHPASPRARGLAESSGVDVSAVAGTGPHGRVIARDVEAASPFTTVGARAVATGVEPGAVGTGLGGRLTRADIGAVSSSGEPAVETRLDDTMPAATSEPLVSSGPSGEPGAVTETPLKGVRKIIATRMMESLGGSAQLTYTATAPAAKLLALRARFKASDPALGFSGITVGDLVGFAAVRTLARHPMVNSLLTDDVVRTYADVHLGMAVDTPRGLLVPTLRQASHLTLREFSAQSKELAAQAIAGSINPDLLQGATFTVTNLGAFGIESFTPILNLPQVAILGVDAITPRVVVNPDGTIGAEQRIGFSLTADHRVIDGADAARYLKDLSAAIADIDLIVMG